MVPCSRGYGLQLHVQRRQRAFLGHSARRRCGRGSRRTVPKAVLNSVLPTVDASHIVIVGSGFLLGLMSSLIIKRQAKEELEKEKLAVEDMKEKFEEMRNQMQELQVQADADRDRVKVLEGARAAAVIDVTKALGQKRDAEFALKDAQNEIEQLKQTDLGPKVIQNSCTHERFIVSRETDRQIMSL